MNMCMPRWVNSTAICAGQICLLSGCRLALRLGWIQPNGMVNNWTSLNDTHPKLACPLLLIVYLINIYQEKCKLENVPLIFMGLVFLRLIHMVVMQVNIQSSHGFPDPNKSKLECCTVPYIAYAAYTYIPWQLRYRLKKAGWKTMFLFEVLPFLRWHVTRRAGYIDRYTYNTSEEKLTICCRKLTVCPLKMMVGLVQMIFVSIEMVPETGDLFARWKKYFTWCIYPKKIQKHSISIYNCIFTYIYHTNWADVGKYTIHWSFGCMCTCIYIDIIV